MEEEKEGTTKQEEKDDKGDIMDEQEETTKQEKKDDNIVFVGKKEIMSYVLAVVTQFNNGMEEVILKARGRAISRAVDVAEVVRQRFVTDAQTKNVKISTEELQGDEGPIKVSAIEITLTK